VPGQCQWLCVGQSCLHQREDLEQPEGEVALLAAVDAIDPPGAVIPSFSRPNIMSLRRRRQAVRGETRERRRGERRGHRKYSSKALTRGDRI
jgi:hypothetical protein